MWHIWNSLGDWGQMTPHKAGPPPYSSRFATELFLAGTAI